jgi:hypothetical protein
MSGFVVKEDEPFDACSFRHLNGALDRAVSPSFSRVGPRKVFFSEVLGVMNEEVGSTGEFDYVRPAADFLLNVGGINHTAVSIRDTVKQNTILGMGTALVGDDRNPIRSFAARQSDGVPARSLSSIREPNDFTSL